MSNFLVYLIEQKMNEKKVPYLEELKNFLSKQEKSEKNSPCSMQRTSISKENLIDSDSSHTLNKNDFFTTSSEDICISSKDNKRVEFRSNEQKENKTFFDQLKEIIEKLDPLEPTIKTIWDFDFFNRSSTEFEDPITDEHKCLRLNIYYPNENESINDPSSIFFIPVENDSTVPNLELRLFFDLEKHKNLIQNQNLNLFVKQNIN